MLNPAPKRTRKILLAAVLLAVAGWSYESTRVLGATQREEIFSFDMWCLEMRLYPAARCDVRRPEDVKSYEQYRAEVEKIDQTRSTRAERDRAIQQKLNPDAAAAKSATPPR
jgi:hypothetical protein